METDIKTTQDFLTAMLELIGSKQRFKKVLKINFAKVESLKIFSFSFIKRVIKLIICSKNLK